MSREWKESINHIGHKVRKEKKNTSKRTNELRYKNTGRDGDEEVKVKDKKNKLVIPGKRGALIRTGRSVLRVRFMWFVVAFQSKCEKGQ